MTTWTRPLELDQVFPAEEVVATWYDHAYTLSIARDKLEFLHASVPTLVTFAIPDGSNIQLYMRIIRDAVSSNCPPISGLFW